MRTLLFLLGLAAVLATEARGDDDCSCWTPDAEDIVAVEAKIAGPLGSLDRYARYYAGTIVFDRRFIQGKVVPTGGNEAPGIHIVEGRMPPLHGKGCITNSESGSGRLLSIKCARPGAWTPSDRQIAELEGLLQLPDGRVLQNYARYYAGVTEGNRQIIIGQVVPSEWRDPAAEIHIVSEVDLPIIPDSFHLGCSGGVNVRYDPSSKEISSRCSASWGSTRF